MYSDNTFKDWLEQAHPQRNHSGAVNGPYNKFASHDTVGDCEESKIAQILRDCHRYAGAEIHKGTHTGKATYDDLVRQYKSREAKSIQRHSKGGEEVIP